MFTDLQTTKRKEEEKKKRKPNQNWANWEENQDGVSGGAKRELQRDGGLQMWNDCVSCASRTRSKVEPAAGSGSPRLPTEALGHVKEKFPSAANNYLFFIFIIIIICSILSKPLD